MLVNATLRELFKLFPRNKIKLLILKNENRNYNYLSCDVVNGVAKFSALPRNADDGYGQWVSAKRQPIKLGKLIKSMNDKLADDEIRVFIELLQARAVNPAVVEILDNEDIRWAYHPNNTYLRSCMNHVHLQHCIDFYAYNKNIKLAVIKNNVNKVIARALYLTALKDLKSKETTQILGRVYGNDEKFRTQLLKWGEANSEYRLDASQSIKWGGKVAQNLMWYVPVEHWDLNYFTYFDHFNRIYKNQKVWTNDCYLPGPYIVGSSSGRTDSDIRDASKRIPSLDPHRPGKIWMATKTEWVPDKDVELVNGQYVFSERLITCPVKNCKTKRFLKNTGYVLDDGRRVCASHKIIIAPGSKYRLDSESSKCKTCRYGIPKSDEYCKVHKPKEVLPPPPPKFKGASSTWTIVKYR